MQNNSKDLHQLLLQLEYQAQQINLLEEELVVTGKALQEKANLADALEQDLEHAIYNLQNIEAANTIN